MATGTKIVTGKSGQIVDPNGVQKIHDMFQLLGSQDQLLVLLHGGLVSKERADPLIDAHIQVLSGNGVSSFCVLWQSDLGTILKNDWDDVLDDFLGKGIRDLLMRILLQRLKKAAGLAVETAKGISLPAELANLEADFDEPNLAPLAEAPWTLADEQQLSASLLADPTFRDLDARLAQEDLTAGAVAAATEQSARERLRTALRATEAPDVQPGIAIAGIGSWLLKGVLKLAGKVIGRFVAGTAHGLRETVFEEVLRLAYIGKVGESIWQVMKRETALTFDASQPNRGGAAFVAALANALTHKPNLRVTLVGHSAGAVFVGELLTAWQRVREKSSSKEIKGFRFANVAMLAPACTYDHFKAHVVDNSALFETFRMFTMSDSAESADELVPHFYGKSLLYFISGVLETEPDSPIVGLQRHLNTAHHKGSAVEGVRSFLRLPGNSVWTPTSPAAMRGFRSQGRSHAGFAGTANPSAVEPQTVDSLVAMTEAPVGAAALLVAHERFRFSSPRSRSGSLPRHTGVPEAFGTAGKGGTVEELLAQGPQAAAAATDGDGELGDGAIAMPVRLIRPTASVRWSNAEASSAAAAANWGLQAIRGPAGATYTGAGVKVAILDTGIIANWAQHPAFQGKKIIEMDFTGTGNGDENGHGTHCAGTLCGNPVGGLHIGVAPGVTELYVGKVLDRSGRGTTKAVLEALLWATQTCNVDVVSMSLGFDVPGWVKRLVEIKMPVDAATSQALVDYADNLRAFDAVMDLVRARSNCVVVAASGNESRRPELLINASLPSAAMGVVAVGAVGPGSPMQIAEFSNRRVTLVAPGVDVVSVDHTGKLRSMNGTSMATPHVAGVAALWWEFVRLQGGPARADAVTAQMFVRATRSKLESNDVKDIGHGFASTP